MRKRTFRPISIILTFFLLTLSTYCTNDPKTSTKESIAEETKLITAEKSLSKIESKFDVWPFVASNKAINPYTLPKPYDTPSTTNSPIMIAPPLGESLKYPEGFRVNIFADRLNNPVWLTTAPNGDIFVSESGAGRILVLRDSDENGVADFREAFAENLDLPFGVAFQPNYMYIATTSKVLRFNYKEGQTKASLSGEKILDLPSHGSNWMRNIIFSPSGRRILVSIGSSENITEEINSERATIIEASPNGSRKRVLASGLRAVRGMAFHPISKKLWAVCDERDEIGDDLPPDFFTEIQRNGFYGWPYAYIGNNPDPVLGDFRSDLVAQTIMPDLLITAHSGIQGLVFYTGSQFPEEYRGDAFIALHGSWNRSLRTGYKIIRVRFYEGRLAGVAEDFLTGWMLGEDKREVWGMPSGLTIAKDGSLLISDDGGNRIWRLSYVGNSKER